MKMDRHRFDILPQSTGPFNFQRKHHPGNCTPKFQRNIILGKFRRRVETGDRNLGKQAVSVTVPPENSQNFRDTRE